LKKTVLLNPGVVILPQPELFRHYFTIRSPGRAPDFFQTSQIKIIIGVSPVKQGDFRLTCGTDKITPDQKTFPGNRPLLPAKKTIFKH